MNKSTRTMVATLGAVAGLAGAEHGIGQVLQGSVAPPGLFYQSWPMVEAYRVLSGEPVLSVIPNVLASGIFAIAVSLAYLLVAATLPGRKYGAAALVLLSGAMLLGGAGIATGLLAFIVGVTATRVTAPLAWWRARPEGARRILDAAWPWLYAACLASWILALAGSVALAYAFGVDRVAPLAYAFILAAFGFMLLAYMAGFARDGLDRNARIGDARNTGSE